MKDRSIKSGRRKPDVEPVAEVVAVEPVAEAIEGGELHGVERVISDDEQAEVMISRAVSAPEVPEHIPNRFYGID